MARSYGRFAAAPIGPQYAVRNGGLIVTATAPVVGGLARSDIELTSGAHGAEFVFWGDDPMFGVVGVTRPDAPIDQGPAFAGIGYRLHSGEIGSNAGNLAAGLPLSGKGDIIGVHVSIGTPHVVTFYRNGVMIWAGNITIAGPLVFAVALAANQANGLYCAVNAGQWTASSPAARAGWAIDGSAFADRIADVDFLSAGTDSPAHARYEGVLLDGVDSIAELSFWPWGGEPAASGGGACRVLDADGRLDAMAAQNVTGASVKIRTVAPDGTVAAATAAERYALDSIEVEGEGTKTLILRDPHDDLDLPLSRGVFLPNVPSLAWRPLPVVIGAVASVPGLPANSDGTAIFLSGTPLASVAAVMDRGDILEAGTYEVAPGNQQVYAYSPPVGPVVADVSTIGAGPAPATLLQALTAIFAARGKTSWSGADAAAIDAVTGYAGVGYYDGDGGTARAALVAILSSYGAWLWKDADGVLRFSRVTAPDAYAGALAFDLERGDAYEDVISVVDRAPNLSRRMAYRPNAQALGASDLVTDLVDLPQPRRDELTGLWRGQVYGNGVLAELYRHAESADPFVSCFWRQQDAQTEIDRVVSLYAMPRSMYLWRVRDPSLAPKPGQIGRITQPRFGLAGGKLVMVRGVVRNIATGDLTLTLWG